MPVPVVWFVFVAVAALMTGVATVALYVDIRCRTCGAWMPRRADYCHVCGSDLPGR